ncbi:carbohydrate ABC transporter permease [Xylanibacillus composti]|nr:carbohydrate ABC transporter permease [Xylanibacillus composti]
MTAGELDVYPPRWLPSSIQLDNYREVAALVPIRKFIQNSFIVSLGIMIGQCLISSMAAYAFVFIRFPGRATLFALVLATMMVPWEVTIIPNFLTVRALGWLDSYAGLIVPLLANAFGIFLLRQAFLQLPSELFEAAKIDGCGHIRMFLTLALPLSRPVLATLCVYVFLNAWNQYLWPLLITNDPGMRTVQIGITMLQWEEAQSWNLVLSGVVLVLLPSLLLLVFGLKQLVQGITAGAIKG